MPTLNLRPSFLEVGSVTPHEDDGQTSLALVSSDPRNTTPVGRPTVAGQLLAVRLASGRGWATGAGGACYLLIGKPSGSLLAWFPVKIGTPWAVLDCMGNPKHSKSWLRCGGVPSA